MKLSAYIVTHDSGFAPNPFGRVCTLACCKPTIRRNADPGDIIVGTGSAKIGLSGHLIYAMRVGKVLSFDTYWRRYPSKRFSRRTRVTRRGDNIWHRDSLGNWRVIPGAPHAEKDRNRDVNGQNVLVSSDFYFFGRNAIPIPHEFKCIVATTQGHKNTYDPNVIRRFWEWIERTAPKRGRIGLPTDFTEADCYA